MTDCPTYLQRCITSALRMHVTDAVCTNQHLRLVIESALRSFHSELLRQLQPQVSSIASTVAREGQKLIPCRVWLAMLIFDPVPCGLTSESSLAYGAGPHREWLIIRTAVQYFESQKYGGDCLIAEHNLQNARALLGSLDWSGTQRTAALAPVQTDELHAAAVISSCALLSDSPHALLLYN